MKLLSKENIDNPIFRTGKYGKAYISNHKNIYFNLSHCDKLVLCSISDREVGVDVEFNDPEIDLDIAKNYFYNSEFECIMNSQNPQTNFSAIGF